MQVLVIQNDAAGPPALFGDWLEQQGATLTIVSKDALPDSTDRFDLIVTLGSPHGAYEDLPWIDRQRRLLRQAAEQDQAVIGICFGAQLLADAIGGSAEKIADDTFHLGWMTNEHAADPVWAGPWMRSHGDHLQVPEGADVLARDQGTVQAYQYRRTVGVQFHPEAGPEQIRAWSKFYPNRPRTEGADIAQLIAETDRIVEERAAERNALFAELLSRTVGRSA